MADYIRTHLYICRFGNMLELAPHEMWEAVANPTVLDFAERVVGPFVQLDNLTLAEWQALDPTVNDVGSTYKNVPVRTQAAEIIAAARKLLSLPAEA